MIRPGDPGDVEPLRALRERYRAELEAVGRGMHRDAQGWESWIRRRLSAGDVRVGLASSRAVGYIAWEVRNVRPSVRLLDVEELYVAPEVRGQRMGSGLLARALDRARALGLAEVRMDRGLGDAAVEALLGQFGFEEHDDLLVRRLRAGPASMI